MGGKGEGWVLRGSSARGAGAGLDLDGTLALGGPVGAAVGEAPSASAAPALPLSQAASPRLLPLGWRASSLCVVGGKGEAWPVLEAASPSLQSSLQSPAGAGAVAGLVLGVFDADRPRAWAHDVVLGRLPRGARFTALARCKVWWMSPETGRRAAEVPPETQLLLVELAGAGGPCVALLPMLEGDARATLRAQGRGYVVRGNALVLRVEAGDAAARAPLAFAQCLAVAASRDPYAAVAECLRLASRCAGAGDFRLRAEKRVPASADVFGWCTWDAFYSAVDEAKVEAGLASLAASGTPARTLILDDGWQKVAHDRELDDPDVELRLRASAAVDPDEGVGGGGGGGGGEGGGAEKEAPPGLVTRLGAAFYRNFVERARANGWRHRIWRMATSSAALKPTLLAFFDANTDFTRRLRSERANAKFPDLGAFVRGVKERHGVRYVYCWQNLMGYWGGVGPDSDLGTRLAARLVFPHHTAGLKDAEPEMMWDPATLNGAGVVAPRYSEALYDALHGYLAEAGVDGVKIDGQAMVGAVGNAAGQGGGVALCRAYNGANERSVERRFAGRCINCMCHSSENLFHFRHTAVARASDDFFPRDPASQTSHLVNCAYNGILLGEVVVADWDMFHSLHSHGAMHAAARACSGGPVYVSDKPGRHDAAVLAKVAFGAGSPYPGRVLRPRGVARPTRDCLFADPRRDGASALKVWNVNAPGANGVVALFHVQGASWDRAERRFAVHDDAPCALAASVSPGDVPGLDGPPDDPLPGVNPAAAVALGDADADAAARFVLYMHNAGVLHGPLPAAGAVPLELLPGGGGFEVATVARVVCGGLVAPLGLVTTLFNGGAAVVDVAEAYPGGGHGGGFRCAVKVRGCGPFASYASRRPRAARVRPRLGGVRGVALDLPVAYDPHTRLATVDLPGFPPLDDNDTSDPDGHDAVLEVDFD